MAEVAGMTCQELVELVTDYLEDALDQETRDRFEQHLALCPGCETYLRQMAETARRLGEIPVETLSDRAKTVLLAAFRDVRGGRTPM